MKLIKNIMQTEDTLLHTIYMLIVVGVITIISLVVHRLIIMDLLGFVIKVLANLVGIYIIFICVVGIVDCLRGK